MKRESLTLLGFCLLAAWLAWRQAWICDDAFITLRYAENWANGLGPVYNAGEQVEGYSNPSWTLLCALGMQLGGDGVAIAQALGIGSFVLLFPALAWAGQQFVPRKHSFPLAAGLCLAHYHLRDFASCGLETLGFVLLTVLLVGALARAQQQGHARWWGTAGLLAVLAALTRPDGGLLGLLAGGVALVCSLRGKRWLPLVAYSVPGILLFVPFVLWRHAYYGEWLPNTFYAKSAGTAYPDQGWFYVAQFFAVYWPLLLALLAAVLLPLQRANRATALLPWFVLPYLLFVVWVGGDFMFARFCLPIVPLLALAAELALRQFSPRTATAAALALVVALLTCAPPGENLRGIADEHAQYPESRVQSMRSAGRILQVAAKQAELRVAFSGTQAMLIYDSKVQYALEAVTGLTDHFLAHRELEARGRIGHEKSVRFEHEADRHYVLEQQRVQLLLFDLPIWTEPYPWLKVRIGDVDATLVRWDQPAMRCLLAQPGVSGTDLDQFLDDYVKNLASRPKPQVEADFQALELVYFRWHPGDPRRGALLAHLGR